MDDATTIPLLAIKDLTVEFKTRGGIVEALHEVGFEVYKREMVGVVVKAARENRSPPIP